MPENIDEQKQEKGVNVDLDLRALSDKINKEIDEQTEKLIEAVEKKHDEDIKAEYKGIVEILAKKLAVETKFFDQELDKKDLVPEKRRFILNEKNELLEDYKKTIVGLAVQIDELLAVKDK